MRGHFGKNASSPVDVDNRIVIDVRCIKCGTNLRGGSIDDPCPGCHHPTSDSVFGDYLMYAERSETLRLEEASRIVIYTALVPIVIFAFATLANIAVAPSVLDVIQRAYDTLFAALMMFPVVSVTGIALLTSRHAAAYYAAKYWNRRCLITGGIALALIIGALVVVAWTFAHVVRTCVLVAWAALPVLVLLHGLGRLMRRMPNIKLANFARDTCVGVCFLAVFTLIFMLVRPLAVGRPDWYAPLIAMQVITTAGWVALAVVGFRLLVLVRRSLILINAANAPRPDDEF